MCADLVMRFIRNNQRHPRSLLARTEARSAALYVQLQSARKTGRKNRGDEPDFPKFLWPQRRLPSQPGCGVD